jgi:hypothetical protein
MPYPYPRFHGQLPSQQATHAGTCFASLHPLAPPMWGWACVTVGPDLPPWRISGCGRMPPLDPALPSAGLARASHMVSPQHAL